MNGTVIDIRAQAFCDNSFTAVSGSTSTVDRPIFAPEFSDRLDGLQSAADTGPLRSHHHQRYVEQQQQQQQRSASPDAADNAQRRTSSQDCDVDLSPPDVDDNDSMQVQHLPNHVHIYIADILHLLLLLLLFSAFCVCVLVCNTAVRTINTHMKHIKSYTNIAVSLKSLAIVIVCRLSSFSSSVCNVVYCKRNDWRLDRAVFT